MINVIFINMNYLGNRLTMELPPKQPHRHGITVCHFVGGGGGIFLENNFKYYNPHENEFVTAISVKYGSILTICCKTLSVGEWSLGEMFRF